MMRLDAEEQSGSEKWMAETRPAEELYDEGWSFQLNTWPKTSICAGRNALQQDNWAVTTNDGDDESEMIEMMWPGRCNRLSINLFL